MRVVMLILIVAMVMKDTLNFGQPLLFRGAAQALCLLFGFFYLLARPDARLVKNYWPLWLYLFALCLSVTFTFDQSRVAIQVASLGTLILFFVAYFEFSRRDGYAPNHTMLVGIIVAYAGACAASLLAGLVMPEIAFETKLPGAPRRFSGLFARPGMMANAAGLLIGAAWFGIARRRLPVMLVIVAIAAVCLFLPLSRTNWGAMVGAMTLTGWLYSQNLRRIYVVAGGLAVLGGLFMYFVGVQIDTQRLEQAARIESLETLSGRTKLWEAGWQSVKEHPIIGNGYTAGANALAAQSVVHGTVRENTEGTLHNGYLQVLLDAGVLGLCAFVLLAALAVYRLIRFDRERSFPVEFYIIVYALIANIGKSFVYSPSVLDSILFFAVATFALSLGGSRPTPLRSAARTSGGSYLLNNPVVKDAARPLEVKPRRAGML